MLPRNFFTYSILLVGGFFVGINCVAPGSKCRSSTLPGTCVSINDCPLALAQLDEYDFHNLKRCGFESFTEIVCCPHSNSTTEPPPEDDDFDKETPQIRGSIRKSVKACNKYSRDLPALLDTQIANGDNAKEGEFPHMAALGFFVRQENIYRFDCGGTLISNYYIVTAAHCIINIEQNELKIVRMGVTDLPKEVQKPDPTMDFNVVNVTVHKNYTGKEFFNDIALVKLEKKVVFTKWIRPACLYTSNDDPEKLCVTGWGAVSDGGEWSKILQKAFLNSVPLRECNRSYWNRNRRNVLKTQLCAADTRSDADHRSDTCQGDSGGPLLQTQTRKSIMTIVGVTSNGAPCGGPYPGIYTRISSYLDWIEGIVWP